MAQNIPRHFFYRAAAAAPVVVIIAAFASRLMFGFSYSFGALASDTLLLLPALVLTACGSRRLASAWILGAVLSFLFVLGHAIKVSFLALPITFADVGPAIQLMLVLPGWRRVVAITFVVVAVVALAWAVWPHPRGWRFFLGGAIYFALLPFVAHGLSLMAVSEDALGVQPDVASVVRERGGFTFAFSSLFDRWMMEKAVPNAVTISSVLKSVHPLQAKAGEYSNRNVHLILVEALWDPLKLKAYEFSRDPWDSRFRELWQAGGESEVLSPVFGGATANAEFEALCGLPAYDGKVVFGDALSRPVPCLPRMLREAGYLTVANHPYQAGFWSRDVAYSLIGFQKYNPAAAYKLDDMDGMFLNDHSMYGQTLARLWRLGSDQPYLFYIVSLSSHYPYDRNRHKRPDLVHVDPEVSLLSDYSNALAYSTSALMDYIESVRRVDPNALIVMFGDHAPVLGNSPDPYVQSGLRSGKRGRAMDLVSISSTPLLVIDGINGPQSIGKVPLYVLPHKVLSLLGQNAHLPYGGVVRDSEMLGRRFLGGLIARTSRGWITCGGDRRRCRATKDEMRRIELVREDLIRGQQHVLDMLGWSHLAEPVQMVQVDTYGACTLNVESWGPHTSMVDTGFNVQPNGKSAIWMTIDEARGDLTLLVGDDAAKVTINGHKGSASFRAPEFLEMVGEYPVRYRCGSGDSVKLGTFIVSDRDKIARSSLH